MSQKGKYKRFALWTLGVLGTALLCAALLVYVVDPFQAYREASFYAPVFDTQVQAYTNPGIAKNYRYDTLVVGSSMCENFKNSQIDELFGGESVKVCYSGGMAMNHNEVLRIGFDTHDIQRVFYGLDMYSFVRKPTYSAFEMPEYLYNDNPFDDVYYLLNHEVCFGRLGSVFKRMLDSDTPKQLNRDDMYNWGDLYPYGEDIMLATWEFQRQPKEMQPYDSHDANVKANFDAYVRPYLEAHPDTEFIFFFPPYSTLQWYIMLQEGHLDFIQWAKETMTEWLLEYDNVKLYDFSAYTDWIEDFSLYKDYSHYKPEINDKMMEMIALDELRVEDIYTVYENDEVLYQLAENFEKPY